MKNELKSSVIRLLHPGFRWEKLQKVDGLDGRW